jgi:mono/diheme cytochrome c family protein
MNHHHIQPLLALALLSSVVGVAMADSGRLMPNNVPRAYTQECAACHTAYPPSLLPARSWQRIMSGLDKHYGTDASLDAATVQALSGWLNTNAGTYKRVTQEPLQDRITLSAWFVRKHDDIRPSVWRLASVKSAANCAACHTGADLGDFDDNNLRQPAGLSFRDRQAWMD